MIKILKFLILIFWILELAEAAGVSKRAIVYWENGKRKMSVESADKIFRNLHKEIVIGKK